MATVLVDIDDTLADLTGALLAYINARARRTYRYEQLTRPFREQADGEYGQLVQDFLSRPAVYTVEPLEDAKTGLRKLHRAGHAVHIASARKEGWHQPTLDWMQEHGFADYVTATHPRTSGQQGTAFKRAVANRIRPAAAFDDTYNVAETLAPACPVVYLIDRPWNREDGLPDNVVRQPGFAAAVDHFLAANG